MNLQRMIAELQAEKSRLDSAIMALERLSASHPKRRGRPPRWLKQAEETARKEHDPNTRPESAASIEILS